MTEEKDGKQILPHLKNWLPGQSPAISDFAVSSLSVNNLNQVKQQLALRLQQFDSLTSAAYLALQADSSSSAFLFGYQCAIRCLHPDCPPNVLAAFAVSEAGVKKPRDMQCRLIKDERGYYCQGEKNYAMLLGQGLERLYVIAQQEDLAGKDKLVCFYLPVDNSAEKSLEIVEKPQAKFFSELVHNAVKFNHTIIDEAHILVLDGHLQANKPFRYWEDIHVSVALLAWACRRVNTPQLLIEHMVLLASEFEQSPDYYRLAGLSLVNQCLELLDQASEEFNQQDLECWQRDRAMLLFGQQLRVMIGKKLMQA